MDSSTINQSSSPEKFVDFLLTDGANIPCDETHSNFNNNEKSLPSYYDENLYKQGQQFFHKHIFALFFTKLLGLLSVLSVPSILNVLIYTKMSGEPMTAYKRYMATIFHMVVWYKRDFSAEDGAWASIEDVKSRHNSASKRTCKAGLHGINQKDMVLTQFGFMGFALVHREKCGLYNVTDDEWRGFIHLWRVVGHLMGIEDRFNLCRDSIEETRAICQLLMAKVFRLNIENKDARFIDMATYLIEGMWCMNPTLGAKTFLTLLYDKVQNDNNDNNNSGKKTRIIDYNYVELGIGQKIHLLIHRFTIWSLQFAIFRLYHNYVLFMSLWLMKVFPFLAYYKFGKQNSHVNIKA